MALNLPLHLKLLNPAVLLPEYVPGHRCRPRRAFSMRRQIAFAPQPLGTETDGGPDAVESFSASRAPWAAEELQGISPGEAEEAADRPAAC